MGNNPSVKQFKTDMQAFAFNVATDFHTATMLMADEVMENIRNAAPKRTGALRASIHKKDVSKDGKVSVLVIGGGKLTTKRTASGHVYDYAVATEFGTVKETAEPFFYSTYRRYKAPFAEQYKETLEQSIEENNRVRQLREGNYTAGEFTRSYGYRGAVVIRGKQL